MTNDHMMAISAANTVLREEKANLQRELDDTLDAVNVFLKENKDLKRQLALFEPMAERLHQVEQILDRYLGTEETAGAGYGTASDVDLLGQQRDNAIRGLNTARKELLRLSGYRELVVHCLRADPAITIPAGTWYVVGENGEFVEVEESP